MKTITKSIALLVATVVFTACSHQTIEPVRPTTPSPAPIMPLNDGPGLIDEPQQPAKPQPLPRIAPVEQNEQAN